MSLSGQGEQAAAGGAARSSGLTGWRTLLASGDLDRTGAALLVALAEHQLAAGYRHVRVDFAGLTSITVAALDALTVAQQELNARGGRLLLTGPSAGAEGA